MSKIIDDLKYTDSHEWVRIEADGQVTIGITDHAQDLLGDIVFVELPEVGKQLAVKEVIGVLESVKSAEDLYTPVAGEVTAINELISEQPELLNNDPYGEAWLFKVNLANNNLEHLLDAKQYAELIAE
ncbi:MAG: glycine cleavage system protein GcvH [Thiomargarita sp.]|nr:glycine cleavage system protein GcvH [Thiomargarita sp.]